MVRTTSAALHTPRQAVHDSAHKQPHRRRLPDTRAAAGGLHQGVAVSVSLEPHYMEYNVV